jgi:hypothetical protein
MTPTGLRGLKGLTQTVYDRLNVRPDHYVPLLCDNQRFVPRALVQEADDLTAELAHAFAGTGMRFDRGCWRLWPHHMVIWPADYTCRLQPNLAFTNVPHGRMLGRSGFGLKLNWRIDPQSPMYLATLNAKVNATAARKHAFDQLALAFGGQPLVESPLPGLNGVSKPFSSTILPPN